MKEIKLLKIIFKDSPDILEPLNEIDKEIERLNNKVEELMEKQIEMMFGYKEILQRRILLEMK